MRYTKKDERRRAILRELKNYKGNKELMKYYQEIIDNPHDSITQVYIERCKKDLIRVKGNMQYVLELIQRLPEKDQEMLMDVFVLDMNRKELLSKYNMSGNLLYYHYNQIARKLADMDQRLVKTGTVHTEILKSLVNEFLSYSYWQRQKSELEEDLAILEERMYELSGISYDGIPQKNRKQNQESRLIQLITDKEKIEERLRFIQSKEDFVDEMMDMMPDDDRDFIMKSLIYRSAYDTNDSIGMKSSITESGVRYKINTIISRTFEEYLTKETKKGGKVEQTAG